VFDRSVALIYQGLALAQAEAPASAPAEGTSSAPGPQNLWIFFVALAAIMYFLMIRPNQKREKERREMLASLRKGDKIVTTGGICGTIVGLTDKAVVLRVSDEPAVKMEFLRAAVSRIASREEDDE